MSESDTKAIADLVRIEFKVWVSGFGNNNLTVNDMQSLRVRIREEKFNPLATRTDIANQIWFFIYLRITDKLEKILGDRVWDAVMALEKENHRLVNLGPVIQSAGEAGKHSMVTMLISKVGNFLGGNDDNSR